MIDIQAKFPGIILDEDLFKYSSFQIGGPADYFYKLKKKFGAQFFVIFANNLPTMTPPPSVLRNM